MANNIEYSRFITKRSTIPGQLPTIPSGSSLDINTFTTTDIFEGELFLNIPDQILYTRSGSAIIQLGGPGSVISASGSAAGLNTQIQYNSGSAFAAKSTFVFDYITDSLLVGDTLTNTALYAFIQGDTNTVNGDYAHAQGGGTIAKGPLSHVEGEGATSHGTGSHAEGS